MTADYKLQALDDPTAVVQELHRVHHSSDRFPRFVAEHFQNLFEAPTAFKKIPTLDVRQPPEFHKDRALVRFRAMVQDTSLSAEMYLAKFPDGSCGGWGMYEANGGSGSSQDVDYTNLNECNALWATSVPGESRWLAEELDGATLSATRYVSSQPAPDSLRAYKYPNSRPEHVGVQVKLYDRERFESYKPTDIVTFVGILSSEPLDQTSATPSDAPTLHVLFSQVHKPPVLARSEAEPSPHIAADNAQVRDDLISWIADEALGGDQAAAEWALLSCIARVQSRHPPLHPPSLTISRFPSPPVAASASLATPTLSAILQLLLPLTQTLPLSLDTLNKSQFTPESKDEDLHAGVLQLPQGTVLLITEGGVREGQLLERGVMNVHALQDVMDAQTLAYVFPFSQFSFPTDISCIVLSEGRKSTFFRTHLNVPLRAPTTPEGIAALYKPTDEIALPSAEKLAAFRDLVVGARSGKVQVSDETSEHIQTEFVSERQGDRSLTADDLIRRMTVAKLYALSLHESTLTIDTWKRAKALDDQRRALVEAVPL
ncbi:putative alanine racemase-domain-containing protein [Lenzites betulinus]|nr:putative alanine racemase-domain-containing protein [Lenzites betulinus]